MKIVLNGDILIAENLSSRHMYKDLLVQLLNEQAAEGEEFTLKSNWFPAIPRDGRHKAQKIVCIDNYDRESEPDTLVAENVDERYAELVVNALNARQGEYSSDYYVLRAHDYRLSRGMEDLV